MSVLHTIRDFYSFRVSRIAVGDLFIEMKSSLLEML